LYFKQELKDYSDQVGAVRQSLLGSSSAEEKVPQRAYSQDNS